MRIYDDGYCLDVRQCCDDNRWENTSSSWNEREKINEPWLFSFSVFFINHIVVLSSPLYVARLPTRLPARPPTCPLARLPASAYKTDHTYYMVCAGLSSLKFFLCEYEFCNYNLHDIKAVMLSIDHGLEAKKPDLGLLGLGLSLVGPGLGLGSWVSASASWSTTSRPGG